MKELFLEIAPYTTFLFLVSFPPEIIRNLKTKTYASGTLISWSLRSFVYLVFGFYSVMIREYVVGGVQFLALGLTFIIIIQSFIFRHAK